MNLPFILSQGLFRDFFLTQIYVEDISLIVAYQGSSDTCLAKHLIRWFWRGITSLITAIEWDIG